MIRAIWSLKSQMISKMCLFWDYLCGLPHINQHTCIDDSQSNSTAQTHNHELIVPCRLIQLTKITKPFRIFQFFEIEFPKKWCTKNFQKKRNKSIDATIKQENKSNKTNQNTKNKVINSAPTQLHMYQVPYYCAFFQIFKKKAIKTISNFKKTNFKKGSLKRQKKHFPFPKKTKINKIYIK